MARLGNRANFQGGGTIGGEIEKLPGMKTQVAHEGQLVARFVPNFEIEKKSFSSLYLLVYGDWEVIIWLLEGCRPSARDVLRPPLVLGFRKRGEREGQEMSLRLE